MEKVITPADEMMIRACKSQNPMERLKSTYRRFYFGGDDPYCFEAIGKILSKLCDEYRPISTYDLIDRLSPKNRFMYGIVEDDDYTIAVTKVLSSHIAMTERKYFPGIRTPLRVHNSIKNFSNHQAAIS